MSTFLAIAVAFIIGVGIGFKYQDKVEEKYDKIILQIKEYVGKL